MTRLFAHLIILFVLFTHSTMAMDVHISFQSNHSTEHEHSTSMVEADTDQWVCADTVGHCTYHFAHAAALVSISPLSEVANRSTLIPHLQNFAITHQQTPPHRPPKA